MVLLVDFVLELAFTVEPGLGCIGVCFILFWIQRLFIWLLEMILFSLFLFPFLSIFFSLPLPLYILLYSSSSSSLISISLYSSIKLHISSSSPP